MNHTPGELQSAEYDFPYHHLPHIDRTGRPRLGRGMRGGMEYLAYSAEVVAQVRDLRPTWLVDVGCGDGRLLAELEASVAHLVGVDLDARAIAHAAAFAPSASFTVETIEAVPGVFDVVTCVETLEHVPDDSVPQFLAAVGTRVRIGGHLIVTVPSSARRLAAKHYRHYDVELLHEQLACLVGTWRVGRLEEIVPHNRLLDGLLRALSNRLWTLDLPWINRRVLASHMRRVPPGRRGLHVIAVVERHA